MKKFKVYLDYEYVENTNRTRQRNVSCTTLAEDTINFFDMRNDNTKNIDYINNLPNNTVILSYNIIAEITTMLRMGITEEKIRSFDWVDLWTESKMFFLTHPDYYSKDTSLKGGAVPVFKLNYEYDMDKDPIDIIINNEVYTDAQFEEIKKYNIADVQILPQLLNKLKDLWKKYGVKYSEVKFRGDFACECAINYYKSNGFPMDTDMMTKVFQNREEVKYRIGLDCNLETGFPIYRAKVKKRPKELSFNLEAFSDFLKKFGLYAHWAKTENKKVSTKEDEFEKWQDLDTLLSDNKDLLQSIYYARSTIKQLNSTNLLELLTEDGYIRTPPFPFNQKSGRSSPKPALGFILNLAPWLRNCILPKPGKAFIAADWSQQEVALAGFFSKDKKLLDSYKGDHYITNAIVCGFVPKGSTKKSHPTERDMMKPTSLGILYGMGEKSMAFRVEAAMGWIHDTDRTELDMWSVKDGVFEKYQVSVSTKAYEVSLKFIEGHKDYYTEYWDFVQEHFEKSKEQGFYKTPISGWYYFVEERHRPTQLQNIPMQSYGACIMQLGYIIASRKYNLSIVCSLHDALYVECDEADIEKTKKDLLLAMSEAVEIATQGTLKIRNEVKIFTNSNPYYDARGDRTYKLIKELVSNEL
jgi:DNA polymerase I-like protein with 3'-5' exonuclease and polymerase domains